MNFLKKTITIITEIVVLILAIIWYRQHSEIEPLILIVTTSVGLILSIAFRTYSRPRIELHKKETLWGRSPLEFTPNNPSVIRVGIDLTEHYWRLLWYYDLEIRNNSATSIYSIEIIYSNLPPNTTIEGSIGKIEPLMAHEMREFKLKMTQQVVGTHIDADKYLQDNAKKLMEKFNIRIKYKDEDRITYYTDYNWTGDRNNFNLF